MRVNKLNRIKKADLVWLGLMEEGEEFDFDKHRINQIEYRSTKEITQEFIYENFIYKGFSQTKDEFIMVTKVNTVFELSTVEGKTVQVKAIETGYCKTSIADYDVTDYYSVKMLVPLLSPDLV